MRAHKKAPAFRRKSTDLHNRKSYDERVRQEVLAQPDSIRAVAQHYQLAFDEAVDVGSDEQRAAVAIQQVLTARGDIELALALMLVGNDFYRGLNPALSVRAQTTIRLVEMLNEVAHFPSRENMETAVRSVGRYRLASNHHLLDETDFLKLLRSLEETADQHNNNLQEALDECVRLGVFIPA